MMACHRPQMLARALLSALFIAGPLAAAEPERGAGSPAPAGQVCPDGSYVIGFDAGANILCSPACGNGVLNAGEACDDGNSEPGDGCSPACEPDAGLAPEETAAVATAEATAAATSGDAPAANLAIGRIKPWSVPYGTREVAITISGTGFNADSVVVFQGKSYVPSVSEAGTRLDATIATRDLAMGAYAITVSNGTDMSTTLKKALVIY
jgi:cysteine-rich repeat protein